MTNNMKKSTRPPGFVPAGTPFQVAQRTRTIKKNLSKRAQELRRAADRVDRLAAKIHADTEAGRSITARRIAEVVHVNPGAAVLYAVYGLCGIKPWGGRDAILDRLFPRDATVGDTPCVPATAASGSFQLTAADAVAQAIGIARSARGDVDWSREPLTDRERAVRARFLKRCIKNEKLLELLALDCRLLSKGLRAASDLAAAMRVLLERDNRREAQRDSDAMREIAEEIDDEEGAG